MFCLLQPTYYSENCCAHMVVAPSSGAVGFPQDGINGMLAANFNGMTFAVCFASIRR